MNKNQEQQDKKIAFPAEIAKLISNHLFQNIGLINFEKLHSKTLNGFILKGGEISTINNKNVIVFSIENYFNILNFLLQQPIPHLGELYSYISTNEKGEYGISGSFYVENTKEDNG